MAHKADSSFFDTKREWSKQKDRHIEYYLRPYLEKVKKLRRPILLIDAFAGPGTYGDGEEGSPMIFCKAAEFARGRGIDVSVKCIEKDPGLFDTLRENLAPYQFAESIPGSCEEHADRIGEWTKNHTVFVYFDPFRPTQLKWKTIHDICRLASQSNSVETLINFHAPILGRWARLCLKKLPPPLNPSDEDTDDIEDVLASEFSATGLDEVLGGSWWRDCFDNDIPFSSQVIHLVKNFRQRLMRSIKEVCYADVKVSASHSIPKYFMVFGTGNDHGLVLMNDSMATARKRIQYSDDLEVVAKMKTVLCSVIPTCRKGQIGVKQAILEAIKACPAKMTESEIYTIIRQLISEGDVARLGKQRPSKDKDFLCRPDTQTERLF